MERQRELSCNASLRGYYNTRQRSPTRLGCWPLSRRRRIRSSRLLGNGNDGITWFSATNAAQQAADLSLRLYTVGLRDFREVLDSQRSLLTRQDSLAASTAQVSTNMIRL